MIEFSWDISKFYCSDTDDYSNVVHGIKARRYGSLNNHTTSELAEVFLETNNIETFIEFADITKETAIEWLESNLGEDKIAELDQIITNELVKLTSDQVLDPPWWYVNLTPSEPDSE